VATGINPPMIDHAATGGYENCTLCHYIGSAGAAAVPAVVQATHACDECHNSPNEINWDVGHAAGGTTPTLPIQQACALCHKVAPGF
jgi:hypothetical protein